MLGTGLLAGALAGAGAMYLLDPERGRRRRALVRDKLVRARGRLDDAVDVTRRDVSHRAEGLAAEARARVAEGPVDDRVLEERVRARTGRVVTHPGALEVSAEAGRVTLSGPVFREEVGALLETVRGVRGVREVVDHLEVHERSGGIPALQGQGRPRERRWDVLQEHWAPATRALVGTAAGAALVGGLRRGGAAGAALALGAAAALGRAATNLPLRRLVGVNAGRDAVRLHKTITIEAPVDDVFDFWSRFENFPLFMAHLEEVRRTGEGLSHWVARGPGGITVAWDAEVTLWEPGRAIGWRSIPGSAVGTAGRVIFQPAPGGGTRLDVHLSYNPPAGAAGHALAFLLRADPKHALDEDLVRLKSLLEDGKTTAHGREVELSEVMAADGAARENLRPRARDGGAAGRR